MTTVLNRGTASDAAWAAMPGWGIVADLTPPELTAARRMKGLRRLVGFGLALVVVLCAAGVLLAMHTHSAAQGELDAATDHGVSLTSQQGKYAKVTQIESATQAALAQQQSLMSTDVDAAAVADKIATAMPASLSLTSVNIAFTGASAGSTSTGTTTATAAGTPIGTVTLSGKGKHLSDLAVFIVGLNSTRGFVNAAPPSNTASGSSTSWNVTVQLTDALLSKRFATGGK